ncbi:hydantoinase B/oxoprolinase family protein [Minwuia thermotolerans]|uniref:Hydantoinase n=1 Tax=Minwuia thermotolerans TaxID=2056226 RepID=A0A2M9FXZ6_9PROT|nr:hydantoinase B/oxoprolinase family protein [Minwuia thermotolerans]PJK28333.1 hydantoinase [Minwuia thermotolerans]
MSIDPVTLALVQNRLDHISRQMGFVMTRTARSPIFNQSHDFSCFIADAAGTLISQADGIPIHTGGGGFTVRALIEAFEGRIRPDDVFLSNDPYVAGGNHLPDWVISRPVFVEGELAAWACNRAHQSDIGGGAAGTYNPEATEIFHEGLRLPPLRLIEKGETRDDLWALLLLNSRTPELMDGDLRAMIGSTRIGAERIEELLRDLGRAEGAGYFDALLDYADMRFREACAEIPHGRYEAEEITDNDCFEKRDIHIRVRIDRTADGLTVDFTGTDPQMKGFKNSSIANTYSAVYMALSSFFDPDLPRNEGAFRSVKIVAPLGTVVNPRPPAPMTMCTVFVAHEIVHAIWKALGDAVPSRACAGWGKTIHNITSGRAPGSTEPFVMYNWAANAAGGAVRGRDGFNQIGLLIALGGLHLPNAETYERIYPVRILQQEFRTDGGGAGEFRGGTGVDYRVETLTAATYSFRGEGIGQVSGFGIKGGGGGLTGSMTLHPAGDEDFEAPQYGVRHFPPALLEAHSPGGGGYGDPRKRSVEAVLRDVMDGVVSPEAAERAYGVAIAPDGRSVDVRRTTELRGAA